MARIQLASLPDGVVQTSAGAVVPFANVMVYTHGTTTPVTVYQGETGTGTFSQPLITDNKGHIPGYVDEEQRLDFVASIGSVTAPTVEANSVGATTLAPWLNLNSFGGKGDGSFDNSNALAELVGAAPSTGFAIMLPDARYAFSSFPSLDQMVGVSLVGGDGSSNSSYTSQLVYTGTGSGTAISARSIQGFSVHGVKIGYSQSGFTGVLVDHSHSSAVGPFQNQDSNALRYNRGGMGGLGIQTAAYLLKLDNAIDCVCRDWSFINAVRAILGCASSGSYSNAHLFDHATFHNFVSPPIDSPGQSWKFDHPLVEPLTNGNAGFVTDAAGNCIAMRIVTPWMGDCSNGTGFWIDLGFTGLSVVGGFITGGARAINAHASSSGLKLGDGLTIHGWSAGTPMPVGVGIAASSSGFEIDDTVTFANVTTPLSFAALPALSRWMVGSGAQQMQTTFRDGSIQFVGNTTGLTSAQIDALFAITPAQGAILIDTTNNIYLQRGSSKWYKSAALTQIT